MLFMYCVCRTFMSVRCGVVVAFLERADLLALLYVMLYYVLSPSHVVSWVRCGT